MPLVGLLRASSVLDRLPKDLQLDAIIVKLRHVLATADGWVHGDAHLLSEGGTQIVQALTQWSEDRGAADRKAVAAVVLAHLLAVAADISAQTVVSWAATRWASVNTLFDYALDRLLPEHGDDPAVVPLGRNKTAAALLDAAHHMGRVEFDYAAYYGGTNPRRRISRCPTARSPSGMSTITASTTPRVRSGGRRAVPAQRLARRWPRGDAARDRRPDRCAQAQGTMCADEVFCGRDPERGVETCTVVEMLAS